MKYQSYHIISHCIFEIIPADFLWSHWDRSKNHVKSCKRTQTHLHTKMCTLASMNANGLPMHTLVHTHTHTCTRTLNLFQTHSHTEDLALGTLAITPFTPGSPNSSVQTLKDAKGMRVAWLKAFQLIKRLTQPPNDRQDSFGVNAKEEEKRQRCISHQEMGTR